MTRKTITSIIALAAVAILIGGYFGAQAWIKAHPKPSLYDFSNYPESPRITEFDSGKINRIENRGEGFALIRNDGPWELASEKIPAGRVNLEQSLISNKLWSISSIWAEQMIEEAPQDLSVYGLDEPYGDVLIGDTEGTSVEFIFGNFTPTRTSRYMMVAGKPEVYTLSTYSIDILNFSLDSVRDKNLAAYLDPRSITHFILEPRPEDNPQGWGKIDITPKDESYYLISTFTSFIMNSPFDNVCGVDSEKFGNILDAMQYLQIMEYVDDNPSSLAPYGLDRPGRLFAESPEGSLDILYGRNENGLYYAKYNGDDTVFSLGGLDQVVTPSPFSLIDKFAMIFSIDNVDSFTVTGDGEPLTATIQGKGDEAVFSLNGRKTADKEFRQFYQAVIGLLIDAEYNGPVSPARGEGADWVVEYKLNTPAGVTASVRLIPYNRDFYILEREGTREFMIARTQARRIYEAVDKMVYID